MRMLLLVAFALFGASKLAPAFPAAGTFFKKNVPPSPPTFEEQQTVGISSNTTLVTPGSLTGVNGDLYLAFIVHETGPTISSVSGLGLTWTLVHSRCSEENTHRLAVYMAQGAAVTGTVTATLSSAADADMMVGRYAGADSGNPIGNILSTNSIGGACTGNSENNTYNANLTTAVPQTLIVAVVAIREKTHSPGGGFTERTESSVGSSNGLAVIDKTIPTAGVNAVTGTLGGNEGWGLIAIEIRP